MADASFQPWTAKLVERWYIAAWLADPRLHNPGHTKALTWPALFVLRPEDAEAFKVWGWAKSQALPMSEVCRGRGWARSTFEKERARALVQIVAARAQKVA